MSVLLILNDWAMRLYQDSHLLSAEPAYISLTEGELVFGQSAIKRSRLHPQQSNNQYLERLNTEPLARPLGPARHHADLLYQQFKQLSDQARENCVIAVPGSIDPEQLGLILGISQEAGIRPQAFVDRAVLGTVAMDLPERFWHLELHLHKACLTELEIIDNGRTLRRKSSEDIAGTGVASLLEGWINIVADQFVQQSRFDPLHTAGAEQQLHDQIFEWATQPSGTAQFRVVQGDSDRQITVDAAQLHEKLRNRLQPLLTRLAQDITLVIGDHSARWAGLTAALQQRVNQVLVEPAHSVATNFQTLTASFATTANVSLKTQLPYSGLAVQPDTSAMHPTHALYQGTADPLEAIPGLTIKQTEAGPDATAAPADLKVNGEFRTLPIRLAIGDKVDLGDRNYELIRVRH